MTNIKSFFSKRSSHERSLGRRSRALRIEQLEDRSLLTAVSLALLDGSGAEGTTTDAGAWSISRSGSTELPCLVTFNLVGTAEYGSDFTLQSSSGSQVSAVPSHYDQTTQTYVYTGVATIGATRASETIQLLPTNDSAKEDLESVSLQLVSYTCGEESGSASGSQSITIADNDDWSVSISVDDALAVEGTSDYGAYIITRSGETDTTHPLSVRFQMSGTSSSSDYTLYTHLGAQIGLVPSYDFNTGEYIYSGTVTIPAGSFSERVELRPTNDSENEGTETAILTLLPSVNEMGVGAYALCESTPEATVYISGTIDIDDNDDWTVSIETLDESVTEGPTPDYATFTITRSGETDLSFPLGVRFQVLGDVSSSDYALYSSSNAQISLTPSYDFATMSYLNVGTVYIPPGASSTTIRLAPINDSEREDPETATIALCSSIQSSGLDLYAIDSDEASASVSILDNDQWEVEINVGDAFASEGDVPDYGTFSFTRVGETDLSYPLSVNFSLSGTATSSDYSLYLSSGTSVGLIPSWDASTNSYVYNGVVQIPYNATSVSLSLRPTDDVCAEEENETATVSLRSSSYYDIVLSETPATIEIVDNDLWTIEVEASDAIAKERLPDVAQDYGYYTFTKAYSADDVVGDDSYDITICFETLSYSHSDYYCAAPGEDYMLSATPLDANDTRTYLENFAFLGSYTEATSLGSVTHYRYQGVIPCDETSASIRLEALFDWLDEGEYYDLNGSPEDQLGELALLHITSVDWNGKNSDDWDALGANVASEIEIRDGAILELYLDYDGEDEFDIERSIKDTTCHIPHNDDDDNENGLDDHLEGVGANIPTGYSGVDGEDDLRRARLYAWVADTVGIDGRDYKFDIYQNLPTGTTPAIRLWNESDKQTLFTATETSPDRRQIGTISASAPSATQEFWLEGIDVAANELVAQAVCYRQDDNGAYVATASFNGFESTELYDPVAHYTVDLDADSDNNGYINDPSKNKPRADAEDAMEERTAKPITYYVGEPEGDDFVYVPLQVSYQSDNDNVLYYSFHFTTNLVVYKKNANGTYTPLSSNYKYKLTTDPLQEQYFVRAVGAASDTGFGGGRDVVHLVLWTLNDNVFTEVARDTVSFKVQDNTKLPQWVVPSGWTISENGVLTTPTPVDGAVGPKTEGSGVVTNKGDAYHILTQDEIANGFTLSFDFSFVRNSTAGCPNGYLQPDNGRGEGPNSGRGDEIINSNDLIKCGFFGNSGVKLFGETEEVQIFDTDAFWRGLHLPDNSSNQNTSTEIDTNNNEQQLTFPETTINGKTYPSEKIRRLISGYLYDHDYSPEQAPNYGVLIREKKRLSAISGEPQHMQISVVRESNNESIIFKLSVSINSVSIFSDYVIQIDSFSSGNNRISLQSHWGSGVSFSNIRLEAIAPQQ